MSRQVAGDARDLGERVRESVRPRLERSVISKDVRAGVDLPQHRLGICCVYAEFRVIEQFPFEIGREDGVIEPVIVAQRSEGYGLWRRPLALDVRDTRSDR